MECPGGSACSGDSTVNNRTLVIPGGTLDGNVTNVVLIPENLESPNQSLIVRGPALNDDTLPEIDHDFDFNVTLLSSTLNDNAFLPNPYENIEGSPVQASYHDSSSGELPSSVLADVMGGAYNVLLPSSPASPYRPPTPRSPDSCTMPSPPRPPSPGSPACVQDSFGTPPRSPSPGSPSCTPDSFVTPQRPPVLGSPSPILGPPTYTPDCLATASMFSDSGRGPPNCGPCLPEHGGNRDLCPPPCPVPADVTGSSFHSTRVSSYPSSEGFDLSSIEFEGSGSPGPVDRTRMVGGPCLNRTRPGELINRTRAMQGGLNRTRPLAGPCLNRTQPGGQYLNRTDSIDRPPPCGDPNRTRPAGQLLNRTRMIPGALDRTRPTVNPDQTLPGALPRYRTFPRPPPAYSPPPAYRTFDEGQPNITPPPAYQTFDEGRPKVRTSPVASPNRSFGSPSSPCRTFNMPRGRPNVRTSTPEGSRTFRSPNINMRSPIPGSSRTCTPPRRVACGAGRPRSSTPEGNRTFMRPDLDMGSSIRELSPVRSPNVTFGVPPAADQTYNMPDADNQSRPCSPCPSEMRPGTPDRSRSVNQSFSLPSSSTNPGITFNRTGSKINVSLNIDLSGTGSD